MNFHPVSPSCLGWRYRQLWSVLFTLGTLDTLLNRSLIQLISQLERFFFSKVYRRRYSLRIVVRAYFTIFCDLIILQWPVGLNPYHKILTRLALDHLDIRLNRTLPPRRPLNLWSELSASTDDISSQARRRLTLELARVTRTVGVLLVVMAAAATALSQEELAGYLGLQVEVESGWGAGAWWKARCLGGDRLGCNSLVLGYILRVLIICVVHNNHIVWVVTLVKFGVHLLLKIKLAVLSRAIACAWFRNATADGGGATTCERSQYRRSWLYLFQIWSDVRVVGWWWWWGRCRYYIYFQWIL